MSIDLYKGNNLESITFDGILHSKSINNKSLELNNLEEVIKIEEHNLTSTNASMDNAKEFWEDIINIDTVPKEIKNTYNKYLNKGKINIYTKYKPLLDKFYKEEIPSKRVDKKRLLYLYDDAKFRSMAINKVQKVNELINSSLETSECTFIPKLNLIEDKHKRNKSTEYSDISTYNRNIKWLLHKKEKILKAKKIDEINSGPYHPKINKIDNTNIFKEQNSVKYKPENCKYFFRLNKCKEKKIEKNTQSNTYYTKIKVILNSHYTGQKFIKNQDKYLDLYKKKIHEEIKNIH